MIIIDTRSSAEFQNGHVEGAINVSPEHFADGLPLQLQTVAKDEQIIVYCLSGARSNVVKLILNGHGFTNVSNGINKDHVARMLK